MHTQDITKFPCTTEMLRKQPSSLNQPIIATK